MAGRRFQCLPLDLDSIDNKADTAEDLGVTMDEVTSGLRGVTIISAPEDSSWLGIGRAPSSIPSQLPQSNPAWVCAPSCSVFSGSLSIATSVLMEPPLLWAFTPTSGAGGARGGGNG
jgi:hypothetical protein